LVGAKQAFYGCTENDPASVHAYLNLATIAERQQEYEEAQSFLLKALSVDSGNKEALVRLQALETGKRTQPSGAPNNVREEPVAHREAVSKPATLAYGHGDLSSQAGSDQSFIEQGSLYEILSIDAKRSSPTSGQSQLALALINKLQGTYNPIPGAWSRSRFLPITLLTVWIPLVLIVPIILFSLPGDPTFAWTGSLIATHEAAAVVTGFMVFLTFPISAFCLRALNLGQKPIRFSFDKGRLIFEHGIFSIVRTNIELYRVEGVTVTQSVLNRRTGDGSLILIVQGGAYELVGLAKWSHLVEIQEDIRNLSNSLRAHPL
jgi:hypothetical protein